MIPWDQGGTMIAVIFEFTAAEGRFADYKRLAEGLSEEVRSLEGFISIERFQSIADPGRFVSISFWRDEEAVRRWRNVQKHREAQAKGRRGIFSSYRLRVCSVIRDYGMSERGEAPRDSVAAHG
jgi:heme-degrading monooxygenase HmoA